MHEAAAVGADGSALAAEGDDGAGPTAAVGGMPAGHPGAAGLAHAADGAGAAGPASAGRTAVDGAVKFGGNQPQVVGVVSAGFPRNTEISFRNFGVFRRWESEEAGMGSGGGDEETTKFGKSGELVVEKFGNKKTGGSAAHHRSQNVVLGSRPSHEWEKTMGTCKGSGLPGFLF